MTIHAFVPVLILATTSIAAQHAWRQVQLPEARTAASLTVDPATGDLVVFGGLGDAVLADTWLRSGSAWTRSQVGGGPGLRERHQVAADLAHNQLVLFGGWSGSGAYGDTWVRGPQGWSQLFPAQSPVARYAHGFAWDAARGRGVLYGGYNSGNRAETWEWTGSDWILRVQSSLPGARHGHAMAYDPDSRATLVFGGHNGNPVRDTWLWDGQTWTQVSPLTQPSARWSHAMVHDPIRHVVVLFGGYSGAAGLGDTWEWSGATRTWTQRATNGPSARLGGAMTFDPRRGRVVLFGGEEYPVEKLSDLWEWDGSAWTQIDGSGPSPRYASRMAYDPQAGTSVLFGGVDDRTNRRGRDDTWLWNGTAWSRANPSLTPPARGYSSLVYDPLRQETVLFGGLGAGPYLGDTWTWRAGAWALRTPANAPSGRNGHAAAFHAGTGEVFLFGGYDTAARNDLWSWDGVNWRDRMPTATLPGARWHASLAYDPILQRLVLFGGYNGSGYYGDTWTWDASANIWTQLPPALSPPARAYSQFEYDRTRNALVLFGGANGNTVFSDTWELRGSSWAKCTQLIEPSARGQHAMTYDTRREKLWAFGGYPVSGGDTWECFNPNPGSFTLLAAPGCSLGTLGVPVLQPDGDSLPYRGENFSVALSGLPTAGLVSAVLLAGVPPPVAIPLPFLGFPQCTLYVSPSILNIPMAFGSPGRAIASLPIPHVSNWVGMSLLLQGAALDPFPLLQLGMSQAGVATVGARHQ